MEMDKLENKKIAIIGVGQMGSSLLKGLRNIGFKNENIILSNRSGNNRGAVARADWLLVSVKPPVVREVLGKVKDLIGDKLILSVAAGVSMANIQGYVGNDKQKVIRLMPNMAVSINSGVVGMYSNNNISKKLRGEVKSLFSNLGPVLEVEKEDDLDCLMFIAACGPALVAYFMETLAGVGQRLGLSRNVARRAILETVRGTLLYLQKSRLAFRDLQRLVSTKGGITEEIIKSMDEYKFNEILTKSVRNGSSKLDRLKTLLKEQTGES